MRVVVTASASSSGKTTLARSLARRIHARFVEIVAMLHGPNWQSASAEELREKLAPIVASDAWVLDGACSNKVGTMVLDAADHIVWLDLPPRVWLPRLVGRSFRRWLRREVLWNGNRESFRGIFIDRDGLIPFALRQYFLKRDALRERLAPYPVVRLRTPDEVTRFEREFPYADHFGRSG